MSGPGNKRRPGATERGRWAAAIAALLVEPTYDAAARRAGVSPATLRRWMRRPPFLRLWRRARRAVVEHAIAQLQQATDAAVTTLKKHLSTGVPAVEVRAAVAILDRAAAGVEKVDLEERLAELELTVLPDDKRRRDPGPWRTGDDLWDRDPKERRT